MTAECDVIGLPAVCVELGGGFLLQFGEVAFAGQDGKPRMAKIKQPALIISRPKDLVFPADSVKKTAETLKAGGAAVETVELAGNRGHLDGVVSMKQAEKQIAAFLAK